MVLRESGRAAGKAIARAPGASGWLVLLAAVGCSSPAYVAEDDAELTRAACVVSSNRVCRALEERDIAHLFAGNGFVMPGFATQGSLPGESWVAAPAYDSGRLLGARRQRRTGPFDAATPLPVFPVGDVTGTVQDQTPVVYFVTAGAAGPELRRSTLAARELSAPEPVTLRGAPDGALAWPQVVALPSGTVVLAFVESGKRAFLGTSADGRAFDVRPAPFSHPSLAGVLEHVGTTKAGQLVLTHQVADDQFRFVSFVQRSTDGGKTFTEPTVIAPGNDDVHDAFVVPRADAGADLYYLHASRGGVFTVFRRSMSEVGALGPEQQVASDSLGHFEKPQARRFADGRLVLVAARRVDPAKFDNYDIVYAELAGDAPRR